MPNAGVKPPRPMTPGPPPSRPFRNGGSGSSTCPTPTTSWPRPNSCRAFRENRALEPVAGYLPSKSLLPGTSTAQAQALCRRLVATHCLYGVDKNPLAVELASSPSGSSRTPRACRLPSSITVWSWVIH